MNPFARLIYRWRVWRGVRAYRQMERVLDNMVARREAERRAEWFAQQQEADPADGYIGIHATGPVAAAHTAGMKPVDPGIDVSTSEDLARGERRFIKRVEINRLFRSWPDGR